MTPDSVDRRRGVDRYLPEHADPALQTPGVLPVPRLTVTIVDGELVRPQRVRTGTRRPFRCSACGGRDHTARSKSCPERQP